MSNTAQIKELIDRLTTDDDLRQELWLHFLSGVPTSSLSDCLEQITINYKIINELQSEADRHFQNGDYMCLVDKIGRMPQIERLILYLSTLGLNPLEISKYKNIDLNRVNNVLTAIYNCHFSEK